MGRKTLGILGLGAFGRLMVRHLAPHFEIVGHDPVLCATIPSEIVLGSLADVAACDVVALAMPVPRMEEALCALAGLLRKGSLVFDVGSVKMKPVALMESLLPKNVDIVATHPLFGPQSAPTEIRGQKIALCPVRGDKLECVASFARDVLGLEVLVTTPQTHDREVALIQGLTHLIGNILAKMEPLPKTMTTKSFNLLLESSAIVRKDSDDLFLAIQRENPFSLEARERFFEEAEKMRVFLKDKA